MSDNDFWVNPSALAKSANGFADKSKQIASLCTRLRGLMQPGQLTTVIGNDPGGRAFLQAHLDAGGQLHEGLQAWTRAVGTTGTSVHTVASLFSTVEDDVTVRARMLGGAAEPATPPTRRSAPDAKRQ